MAHTTPSPPKKFDKDTMIAEARRALSLDDTSKEDRQAALRYLLQNKALPRETLVREILNACGAHEYDGITLKAIVETLFDRMPDWLKVGAYVLDRSTCRNGALRRVLDVNSVFVKMSEVLATVDDGSGKYRQSTWTNVEKPEPITVIWSGMSSKYEHVSDPKIIPASFAEMVRENDPLTHITGVSFYIPSPGEVINIPNGFALRPKG